MARAQSCVAKVSRSFRFLFSSLPLVLFSARLVSLNRPGLGILRTKGNARFVANALVFSDFVEFVVAGNFSLVVKS